MRVATPERAALGTCEGQSPPPRPAAWGPRLPGHSRRVCGDTPARSKQTPRAPSSPAPVPRRGEAPPGRGPRVSSVLPPRLVAPFRK